MDELEKLYLQELTELSVQADQHEDTLLLLIALNENQPFAPEELLYRINDLFSRYGKTRWTTQDLAISQGLLMERGMIEPDG